MSDLTERLAALHAKQNRIRALNAEANDLRTKLREELLVLSQEVFDVRPGDMVRLTKDAHPCKTGEEVKVVAVVPSTFSGELGVPTLIVLRKKKDLSFGAREHRLWVAWRDAREPYWEKIVEETV